METDKAIYNLQQSLNYCYSNLDRFSTELLKHSRRMDRISFVLRVQYFIIGVLIAFIASFFFSAAEAQEIPVNVVIVRHPYAPVAIQKTITKLGLKRLKETGVTHPIVKVTVTKDICNKNGWDEYVGPALDCWIKQAYKRKWCVKGHRCFVAKPPVYDANGVAFGGGVANGTCTVNPRNNVEDFSYSIIREFNSSGLHRVGASINAVAHENGHSNGAEHDDGDTFTVMNQDALKFGNVRLPWSKYSKYYIDVCMLDEGLRPVSKYGFGNATSKRSYKSIFDHPTK